ncbi:TPA_asm: O-acetyltransferase [Caudoviricetes sp. vir524]|jgi:peptidoglycan/LPS O-acetylase OafA/YrhL|nr:TPA_asm: O-acetyltransferase [Caudoviricetes sp. vir524]
MANGKRLLFFDLLRILSVALIVFYHLSIVYRLAPFDKPLLAFNIIYLNPGLIGVTLMIFVSGAVLEYSRPRLESLDEIAEFYVKRLFRIYPAFWMSMIFGLICSPYLVNLPVFNIFLEFTGFNTWSGTMGGHINQVGWFIGLIVALYFLYPFLSSSIKKYPYQMLCIIAFVEIFTRYFVNVYSIGGTPDRWLPFCNFLEFGLGIWVVQQGFYPKWTSEGTTIPFLAEISFYVFLIHYPGSMLVIARQSLPVYFIAVGLVSWLVMLGDREIQRILKDSRGLITTF